MQLFKNSKTFFYYLSIPILILLLLSLLSACFQKTPALLQTYPTLVTTRIVDTTIPDHTSSSMPSNLLLQDQDTIVPVETREGVSIAITWVYADSARIGIEYRIHGVNVPEGYYLYCPVSEASLNDYSGKEYEKYIWPPTTGPSEDFEFHCKQSENGNDYIVTQNYYDTPPGHSQSYSLALSIDLGGFSIYTKDGTMKEFPNNGPFTFYFEVPITGSLTLNPNMTQSKNGVVVTLDRLVINPSVTDSFLCILYDNHKGWYPDMTLTWEGTTYKADETSIFRMDIYHKSFSTYLSQFTTERCYRYSFFLTYKENSSDQSPRQMVVSLNKMTINAMDALTQEDCNKSLKAAQLNYPELDFSCNIDISDQGLGVGININKLPPGIDQSTAIGIAEEGFKSIVEGPFNFIVIVP